MGNQALASRSCICSTSGVGSSSWGLRRKGVAAVRRPRTHAQVSLEVAGPRGPTFCFQAFRRSSKAICL
eukprot:9084782-Alexandrium_andersonii.AAC.1